ncbi:FMN-dependent NADH-azoreductase [Flavobacterium sp. J27]|uniref:FMN-dependent NADH-azoreductase n=1 Tax=Flavobacterium sp. J27 TaxID=2060419 RepID=UPI00102FB82F|nr:NAD(P)H-dependent oxidoreductase [Flavobacterium sp. J27]
MNTKRVLHLVSSIQGNNSYSIKLGNAIVGEIVKKYPESIIEEINLAENEIPHLSSTTLQAMFTPEQVLSENQIQLLERSNQLIKQLLNADILVIGAPLINFTIPSNLKSWIDHITRVGITFGYSPEGFPIGKVTGKKVYIAMTSGGIYSEGAGKENDFVAPYLQSFLGFLGMKDSTVIRAEGLKVKGIMEKGMEKALESIKID